jgi:DNA-binding SARP family transcriptional activator
VLLLGPVRLRGPEGTSAVGAARPRLLLAQLALAEGRVVSADRLIDSLWDDAPPANARNTLHYHVTALRRILAAAGLADTLLTLTPGYAITLPSDLSAFASFRHSGEVAARNGDAAGATEAYTLALRCWRGPALEDLREFRFAGERAVALDSQRLTCLEAWGDAELERGHAEALIAPLQGLVCEHPTRERLWEQLMVALHRSGRRPDALEAYRRARAALDHALGVEPSERLQRAHLAILRDSARPAILRDGARPAGVVGPEAVRARTTRLAPAEPEQVATITGPDGVRVRLGSVPLVLGRHAECGIVLADPEASRQHAQVHPTASGHAIVDLGSTNGTFVNGVRLIRPTDLRHGDHIAIGHTLLRYEAGSR